MLALRPGDCRGQRRIDSRAVGHQVRHLAVAEGFLQQRGIGIAAGIAGVVGGRVGGLAEEAARRGEIAANHRQPAQLEQCRAGQGMVELAAGHHRALQGEDGLPLAAHRGLRHAQLDPHPGLRPVIGRPDAAPKLGHQLAEEGIAGGQRPQQLRPPPDRQRRAVHDLLHVDRHQRGRGDHAAVLDLLAGVDLPLGNHHVLGKQSGFCPPRAGAPGHPGCTDAPAG